MESRMTKQLIQHQLSIYTALSALSDKEVDLKIAELLGR